MDFIVDNIWHILWILGVFSPHVRTASSYFWQLIGYTSETRWELSPVKIVVAIVWLVLSSHLFIGIP